MPYDSTVTARAGARDGPDAMIHNSEDMETYDVGLGFEPYLHGIYTSPAVFVTNESPEAMIDRVHAIATEYLDDGKFLVTFGGEHTVAVGSFRAHRDRYSDLSVLAIDAHADLRDEYQDTRYNHACTLRRMLDDVPVTQVGLRSAAIEEAAADQGAQPALLLAARLPRAARPRRRRRHAQRLCLHHDRPRRHRLRRDGGGGHAGARRPALGRGQRAHGGGGGPQAHRRLRPDGAGARPRPEGPLLRRGQARLPDDRPRPGAAGGLKRRYCTMPNRLPCLVILRK